MDSSLSSTDSDDEGIGDKEKKKKKKILKKKKKKKVRASSLAGCCAAPDGPAVAAVQHGRTGDNLSLLNQQIPVVVT